MVQKLETLAVRLQWSNIGILVYKIGGQKNVGDLRKISEGPHNTKIVVLPDPSQ